MKQELQLNSMLTEAHSLYGGILSSYAYFKLKNRGVSEDLVQNTFMKTWLYLTRGGKIEKMKAFLYHVLNNLIVDEYRKHRAVSLDTLMEKGFEPTAEETKKMQNIWDGKAALLLIEKLPPVYKNIMYMKYLEDLSTEEISLRTGLSKNTVAVRLHRGVKKMKVFYTNQNA